MPPAAVRVHSGACIARNDASHAQVVRPARRLCAGTGDKNVNASRRRGLAGRARDETRSSPLSPGAAVILYRWAVSTSADDGGRFLAPR